MPDNQENFGDLANASFIDAQYAAYCRDRESVDSSWRAFFAGYEMGSLTGTGSSSIPVGITSGEYDAMRVSHMIDSFRTYGHLQALDNPIKPPSPSQVSELTLHYLGFRSEEWEQPMPTCGFLQDAVAPLSKIYEALEITYCGKVGLEFMGFGTAEMQTWIQKKVEPYFPVNLDAKEKRQILNDLYKAELFEAFIHTKYVGQKRFSLEGAETLIPMLERLVDKASEQGVHQTLLGMAHRGRLNVLANVLGKSYALIFHEFEDHYLPDMGEGTGDVKYHKGFFSEVLTASGHKMGITLVANPSHLESVDPVVLGSARAMQVKGGYSSHQILPILIHGDASVAGQGVVYETIQLSNLHGYGTGGTIHIVVNNQIGFTTVPEDSRSTRYCTDIGKAFGAPIFHVNAENPEECVYVIEMAFALRQAFSCDVFIDLICYRKYGHNEGDEPTFTQPLEYQIIKAKQSILRLYKDRLEQDGLLSKEELESWEKHFQEEFQQASVAAGAPTSQLHPPAQKEARNSQEPATAVAAETLRRLGSELGVVPAGFEVHPKVRRVLQDRIAALQKEKKELAVDWATAETLAYATLLEQGVHVRISGQDVRRGTFSHRHAMLVDQKHAQKYFPLSHLPGAKALFDIYNSPLSEFAVMGFEYGYSLVYHDALVIWEAQFGDFVNGAQIMVDQYLASSEQKWGAASGLTLLLPHGYEGQGPEHSSGRMERFLQLAADDNMRIVDPTTPAQLFHLLRRQALYKIKKPLILFSPKALLRHPLVLSPLQAFEEGGFQPVLGDFHTREHPRKVLLCSGKVYYDLFTEREKRGLQKEIAIIRVEQLYPFPGSALKTLLAQYSSLPVCQWVQEEPGNMGAYPFVRMEISQILGTSVGYAGRAPSASTAAGSYVLHKKQYAAFMEAAMELK